MNKTEINVSDYILSIIRYLKGDLIEFKKLSTEVESKELFNELASLQDLSQNNFIAENERRNESMNDSMHPNFIKPKILSRMTIPIAITLFSVVDVLGYLVGEHECFDYEKKRCFEKTDDNFKAFFKYYLQNFNDEEFEENKEDKIGILNYIFRQGLVHVYFPKNLTGVAYHSVYEFYPLFFKDDRSELILNVKKLECIVTKTMDSIYQYSIDNIKMASRFNKMINYHKSRDGQKIINISAKLPLATNNLISTQTTILD